MSVHESASADALAAAPKPEPSVPSDVPPPARERRFGAGMLALLVKLGPKLFTGFVKFAKAVKLGKVGLAGASLGAYASIWTWQFAVVVVASIAFHEYGHVWAMKRRGMRTRGFYLLPFVGGAAVADSDFPSEGALAYVAIMGPVFGFVLAAFVGLMHELTGSPILAAMAGWMAAINLLNLLPVNPLDGGRITRAIAFSLHSWLGWSVLVASIVAAIVLSFRSRFGLFGLLAIIGLLELVFESAKRKQMPPRMRARGMLAVGAGYALLVLALWQLMHRMQHEPGAAVALELLKD